MTQDETWLLKEKYNGAPSAAFEADCERLAAGEPLAYIIGHVPFLGTTIYLDSRPLIPRVETEYWVERVLRDTDARGCEAPARVLDLCAGSGCIGVALLHALPTSTVDFVELDERHHTTIERNVRENGIDAARVSILGGNLFERVTETYDLILSNPPYLDETLKRADADVIIHEPALALWGGKGGIELIEAIVTQAPKHLSKNGVLYLEHEPEHAPQLAILAEAHGFTAKTLPDQFGLLRYTSFTRAETPPMRQ